jgi:hypoxanthine phosphoribosyltransferase
MHNQSLQPTQIIDQSQVVVGNRTHATKPLFSAEAIASRVAAMAKEIEADFSKLTEITVIICLDGAIVFAADLIRQIGRTTRVETVKIKSYSGTQSSGSIELVQPLRADLRDRDVLLVEDIIDTGRSIAFLRDHILERQPASLRIATLLDKPSAHLQPVKADYIGFEVGPQFVVGYGLDIDGRYRNFPNIMEVQLDDGPKSVGKE